MLPKFLLRLAALFSLGFAAATMTASAADASLLDTRWTLESVRGLSAIGGRGGEPHMILGPDGGLRGSTGCNRMGGGFTVDGDTIAFGPIRTTRMYCADAYRTEQELLKAFSDVARFVITGDRLELLTRDGVTLAVFVAG
ncbi:MAG TPA: META domain-containing protein [Bauldia sp.]|nr:META domain-containing protein [Bauldia sp.]